MPHLEEALDRAAIPAFFARGATRPEPGGRALLALLACAAEKLSARRFAEYLSLAQVPDPDPRAHAAAPFVAPEPELAGAGLAAEPVDCRIRRRKPTADRHRPDRRWSRARARAVALGAACSSTPPVIGGRERWERRLDGLARGAGAQTRRARRTTTRVAALLDRRLLDLDHLRDVALPLMIARSPRCRRARRGANGSAICARSPRSPCATRRRCSRRSPSSSRWRRSGRSSSTRCASVLAERLGTARSAAPRRRYGAVFVAPAAACARPGVRRRVRARPGRAASSRRRSPRIRSCPTPRASALGARSRARSTTASRPSAWRCGWPWARRAGACCSRIRASTSSRAGRACRRSTRSRCCAPPRAACPASTSSR